MPAQTEGRDQSSTLPYIEKELFIPDPLARPLGLDALEVRASLPGKHPLALLTHGTASNPTDRDQVTSWRFLPQALWFARRGYVALVVVRRGYGHSGGEIDSRMGGCGTHGSFGEAAAAGVEDLKAAARYAAKLAEVDASTIISAGVSTGGLLQAALSAEPMPGLKAAINFAGGRGGDGKGHNCDLGALVDTFHRFGKHNKIPMLWIYAENDKWFPPQMAKAFDEAFKKGGGDDQFVMMPPDGEDGHHLFYHSAKWSPVVEDFLRKHAVLPLDDVLAPPTLPNQLPPPGLADDGLRAFRQFLTNGPFKAFATNGSGGYGYSAGRFTQAIADTEAVSNCKRSANGTGACKVVERGPQ